MTLVVKTTVVSGNMKPHFAVVSESFTTDVTLEGRLPSVVSDMDFIPMPVGVGIVAVLAFERPVQLVSLFVHGQISFAATLLFADVASVTVQEDWYSGEDYAGNFDRGLWQSHAQRQ